MLILDTLNEIGLYRVGLIFKSLVNVICIFIPILITILCIIDVFTIVMKPNEARAQIKTVVDRIIAGLIVFIIPTIVNYTMSLVDGYDPNTVLKYYEGASKQKIQQLEQQYEKEQKAARNKKLAEDKEAAKKAYNEEEKRREQSEEQFKEWQEERNNNNNNNSNTNNNNSNNNNSNTNNNNSNNTEAENPGGNGNYGLVTVSNGVFTIPNRRATSNADTPKQSGPYGVNPIFGERLTNFINAAKAAGYKITVTSGWRSYSSQRKLWDNSTRPCNTRSKWVACPGGSKHGFGIAADLKFNGSSCRGGWDCNAAAKWAHANAGKYGLKFRMSWEPWHIEPAQVKGGKFGSCNAKC